MDHIQVFFKQNIIRSFFIFMTTQSIIQQLNMNQLKIKIKLEKSSQKHLQPKTLLKIKQEIKSTSVNQTQIKNQVQTISIQTQITKEKSQSTEKLRTLRREMRSLTSKESQQIKSNKNQADVIPQNIPVLKKDNNVLIFQFPSKQFLDQPLTTIEEFRKLLQNQKLKSEHFAEYKFKKREATKYTYYYFQCKNCECSKIIIKPQKNSLVYQSRNNIHQHDLNLRKKAQNKNSLLKCIENNTEITFKEFTKYKNQFFPQFPQRKLVYLYSLNKKKFSDGRYNKKISYSGFRDQLEEIGFISEILQNQQQSSLLVYPKQIKYSKFMDIIYFMERKLITNDLQLSNNNIGSVGIFLGIAQNSEPIFFSISLMYSDSVEIYFNVFKRFFEVLNAKPSILYTNNNNNISQGLKMLSQQGIFTGFHAKHPNFSQMIPENRNKLKDLLAMKNTQHFLKLFKKLQQQDICEQQMLRDLQENSFANGPDLFRGLPYFIEKTADKLFRTNKVFSSTYPAISHQILKGFCKNYELQQSKISSNKIITQQVQILLSNKSLSEVRTHLHQSIFSQFFQNLIAGLKSDIFFESTSSFNVVNADSNFKVFLFGEHFQCQCRYTPKAGLPCQHILKAMWYLGHRNYFDYIHPRWKINQYEIKNKPKLIENSELSEVFKRRPIRRIKNYKKIQWDDWKDVLDKKSS